MYITIPTSQTEKNSISSLFDHVEIKSKKPIEAHVLSSVETNRVKWYHVNPDSKFPIYIHSLKCYNEKEFIYSIKTKIRDEGNLNEKELLMLSLLCFMETEKDIPEAIHDSATIITNMPNLNNDVGQFIKGIILMLCDKFVDDELLNTRIINKVGGNMKVVEDYADRVAERKVNEKNETFVIRLRKKGFKIEEIAETADVSRDFVEKILAKVES